MKAIFYLVVAVFLAACGSQPEPTIEENTEENPRLRSEIEANEAIEIGPLITRSVVNTVESSGRVTLPPNGIHTVHSSTEGYVSDFKFQPGDKVSKGTELVTITFPGLIDNQRLFLETEVELERAQKDLNRKDELRKSNATSVVAFEEAESRVRLLEARSKGLRKQLELWGINIDRLLLDHDYQNAVRIVAPIGGVIDEIFVHPGQMITPEDPIMNIATLKNLHLDLQVLARHASAIRLGQKVEFTLPGETQTRSAVISKINPQMNPGNETLNFHAHPDQGSGDKLIPGMFVKAQIKLDSIRVSGLPVDAVIRQEGLHYAYGLDNDQVVKQVLQSVERLGDLVVFDSLPYREYVIKGAYYME
ncbi:MAG TPA: efflux RND transporter periplasmic adaptor subunit [Sphingobacteriaceae bacterium]|nr:efflux RND transporter periplasmic adaptor subunit [Sphingobacteriaceae bacterium]